jgi:hypothetical protein
MKGHHWITVTDGWRCIQCQRHVTSDDQLPTPCPAKGSRAGRFAEAIIKWEKAGRPTRSDDLVRKIFDNHCCPCSEFDKDNGLCSICTCKVQQEGVAVLNKIAMATEHCPRRKW